MAHNSQQQAHHICTPYKTSTKLGPVATKFLFCFVLRGKGKGRGIHGNKQFQPSSRTRTGVSHDANLFLGFDGQRDAFEGWGEGVVVAHAVLVEGDGALAGPIAGYLTARAGYCALCLKILHQGRQF